MEEAIKLNADLRREYNGKYLQKFLFFVCALGSRIVNNSKVKETAM